MTPPDTRKAKFSRVMLKISGEALMGDQGFGLHPPTVQRIAQEVKSVLDMGVEICMVIGGGNIFRGAKLAQAGMERVTGDHMGMLATVMNALALQDALERHGLYVRVMSAIRINEICEDFLRRRAIRHLEKRRIVVFAAGTGNPFFTTDSAASLRAIEIEADLMIKATKVDGVYSEDPVKNAHAERYTHLDYDDVLERKLDVMDATAVVLCRDHGMRMRVLDMGQKGALLSAVCGDDTGTLVESKRS